MANGILAQNYRTAQVNVLKGEPNDTAFITSKPAVQSTTPDSTYAIPLDGNGDGQTTVLISKDDIGLGENMLEHVNYYPNPFNNQMNVSYDRTRFPELDATVFNLSGQQVQTIHDDDGQMKLDINGPDGVYIVHLQGENAQSAFKVLKNSSSPSAGHPKQYRKKSSTGDSLDANFNFSYNPRRNDSTIGRSMTNFDTLLTRNNTYTFDLGQLAPVWDTAFANGGFVVRDKQNSFVKFAPLELTPQMMTDVNTMDTTKTTTSNSGIATYSNLITDIDTTGMNQHDSATYKISWPFVHNPSFDSTSATPSFPGWVAGDTLVKFSEGNNGVTNLFLDRATNPNIAGKKHYAMRVGVLKDGSPNSQNSIADSALVVIDNITQNTTDSLWTTSTTTTSPNGIEYNAVTSTPYNHNDTLNIAIGAPNDTTLKGYTGMQYVVTGSSYNDIANGDTIETIMANLIPDTLFSGADPNGMNVSAYDIKDMHENPNYHIGRFDTVGYYIDTASFPNQQDVQDIRDVADSATAIGPTTYIEVQQPFTNPNYNSQTATTFSHGANVQKGSNFIASGVSSNTKLIKGDGINGVFADVYVSGSIPEIWKELVFQYHSHDGVNPVYRPSVMNGNPTMPTLLDFVVYTVKNNIETEQFQNNTQNISINYLTDSNSVIP